jgi:beta-lactamase class A
MITLPPSTQPTNPFDNQTMQVLQTDLKSLANDTIGDYFKSLRLRHYIETIIAKNESLGVVTGVSIIDLQTQQSIVSHNLDTEQFAASVNKVPIAELVLRDLRAGTLTLDQQLTWAASDVRGGAGVYDQPGAPLQASVRDLLFDMLNPSGNTAVRVFVNQAMGGAVVVNGRFTNELGLQHTYLQPLDSNRFYVGNTTAREAMKNIRALLKGNDQYQKLVKNALATNIYTDFGVRSQLAGNDYIVLANKVGILDDPDGNNRHDVGLIYNTKTHKTYAYAFMDTAFGESYNAPTAQAGISLADMGRGVLRYSGDKQASSQDNATLDASAGERLQLPAHEGQRLVY